jgi:hypothetical protein
MIQRVLACALAVLFLVAFPSNGADFDGDWRLDQLTCEELRSGYAFNVEILEDILKQYKGCLAFYTDAVDSPKHGDLHCALIRKEGMYVKGFTNDIVAVFNTKCVR